MKLLIKQRVFSWSDTYDIYDEEGEVKYFVKAEFLSIGHRLHVFDRNGKELGIIREKVLSFLPVFEIEIDGVTKGQIKQQFTLLRSKYDVDYNGWYVEGISSDGTMRFTAEVKWWSISQRSCFTGAIHMCFLLKTRRTNWRDFFLFLRLMRRIVKDSL